VLSETCSISTKRRDGWSRVCNVWGLARSTVYDWQPRRRPQVSEEDLVVASSACRSVIGELLRRRVSHSLGTAVECPPKLGPPAM
jgi:hypothetical protein